MILEIVVVVTLKISDKTAPGLEQNSKAEQISKISFLVKCVPPFEGPKFPPSF